MDLHEIAQVTKPIEPYYWKEHKLTVIRDGYLADGTRVHIVRESTSGKALRLNNAIVFGESCLLDSCD